MQHNLLRAPDDSVRESAIRYCVMVLELRNPPANTYSYDTR